MSLPPPPSPHAGQDPAIDTENGIRLGGAWRNFSERIRALETENQALTERLAGLSEDRDSLLAERADMAARFHDSVASLTQEFSGHLKSLQIIETIRKEKLSLSDKAEAFESLCAKLTAELQTACNEITIRKQECVNWRATAGAKETLLGEEKAETTALRDMVYKKDEQIEAYLKRIESQDADIDTMKRAIATKDRQLVLLVKERDRYKNEVKAMAKGKKSSSDSHSLHERPEFDLSGLGSLSFIDTPCGPESPPARGSPAKPAGSPRAAPKSPSGYILASPPLSPSASPHKSPLLLDANRSFSKSLETSEREYKAIIRKLRSDLDAARAIIDKQSSRGGSRTSRPSR